jgi:hypothetical protein
MSCGWKLKWLEFSKERQGANYQSKRFGINKEMKVFRMDFAAQQLLYH